MAVPWWKSAVAYQVYPRSFCDSNGDGIGDIPGIVSKLDYLSDLGIGILWLSPVYRSPMHDNGYDIADYRDIAPEYGTLTDMERLIGEADRRGIRIVMDLVVNHTSDRHGWFLEASASREAPKRDYYIWRDPAADGGPPSGLASFFGGPAWTYSPETGQYYLHLFAPQQPDLNWHNPALRRDIYDMMLWWLDRGIGGFRMDVIDLIGKDIDRGLIAEGPFLWSHLDEMFETVLRGRDVVTIGETWHASLETGRRYVQPDGRLSMIFQFDHITALWGADKNKWADRPLAFCQWKRALFDWQKLFSDSGWNSVFIGNHDLPRSVTALGDGSAAAAKSLATVLICARGTPFIYQGDELGMPNAGFTTVGQYRDVETLNMLHGALDRETALAAAARSSRDNARTPMRWTPEGGFTSGTPWIGFGPDVPSAAEQERDIQSVMAFYRRLIALRRSEEALQTGGFEPLLENHPQIVAFCRTGAASTVKVLANLSGGTAVLDRSELDGWQVLLNSHREMPAGALMPRQAVVIRRSATNRL